MKPDNLHTSFRTGDASDISDSGGRREAFEIRSGGQGVPVGRVLRLLGVFGEVFRVKHRGEEKHI